MKALVYTIVVTYNGRKDIERCLESLENSEFQTHVLIVDNASEDGTLDVVRGMKLANLEILPLKRNLGFGRANNIGVKYAYERGGEHFFFVNQDVSVFPGTLGLLVETQRQSPDLAVLSPLQLDGTGTRLDALYSQHICKSRQGPAIVNQLLVNGAFPLPTVEVDFVNAAVWLLSRKCIEQVGLFNSAFKHYGEDVDYARRVWAKGLHVGIELRSRACHHRSQELNRMFASPARVRMFAQATILGRLIRVPPSTPFNVLSALSHCLLCKGPHGNSWQNMLFRVSLLWFLARNLMRALKARAVSRKGGKAFWAEAEKDSNVYLET